MRTIHVSNNSKSAQSYFGNTVFRNAPQRLTTAEQINAYEAENKHKALILSPLSFKWDSDTIVLIAVNKNSSDISIGIYEHESDNVV